MNNLDPEILHISHRESPPDSEYKYLDVRIVFQVFDEEDALLCNGYCENWSKSVLYEVETIEQIENHYLHTKFSSKTIENSSLVKMVMLPPPPEHDITSKIKNGWSLNPFNFLQKAKKSNIYIFREYVEDNAITQATLQLLSELKDGKGRDRSRFVLLSEIIRCLTTLNTFWD